MYNLNAFTVDHPLGNPTQARAPFDTYYLSATVFAIEKATNRSVPIIAFAAGEGPNNFVLTSFSYRSSSNYTYDNGTGPTTVEAESGVIYIQVRRSQLAKAFMLCLLLINFALTVGSVYVTVLVLTRKDQIHEGTLLFPVTVILTIPALRNLYPGEPPFGIYIGRSLGHSDLDQALTPLLDTFGLFLLMMIVALCSTILLYVVAKSSKPVQRASRDDGKT